MSEQMDFNDGKYTVISDNGRLTALRYGEPWNRDLTGDNLIYWMLVEAIRLKEERHPGPDPGGRQVPAPLERWRLWPGVGQQVPAGATA